MSTSATSPGNLPATGAPPHRAGPMAPITIGLLLIALGALLLAANLTALTGSILFLGIGAAFLVARITTGNYGFSVPAGILLGFGAFVALEEAYFNTQSGLEAGSTVEGGWFFLLLGLGFLAVYLIGARPDAVWPLFPAAILGVFGLLLAGQGSLAALAPYAWIATYWPVALVLVGVWLLVRDRVPLAMRTPVAVVGLALLVVYGLVAVGAALAAVAEPDLSDAAGTIIPRIGGPAAPPITESTNLSASIGPGQTLQVVNTNGTTRIRPAAGDEVRVTATKHLWWQEQTYDVRLQPTSDGLLLQGTPFNWVIGLAPRVDYAVEAPAATRITSRSSSGNVNVQGLSGPVDVDASSGSLDLANLSGPVTVHTSSGSQRLTGIRGELQASSSSGSIRGTGLERVRQVSTSSGDVVLGMLADGGRIQSSSGSVTIRFAPGSSVRIDVSTSSGNIRTDGLNLTDVRQDRRSLTGSLGGGSGVLTIRTSSGDVMLAGE